MEFAFHIEDLPSEKIEHLLQNGFRHFGNEFFIYQSFEYGGITYSVIPLRLNLHDFRVTKKQRKCLRNNSDLHCSITPTMLTSEYVELFEAHKEKFQHDAPQSIFDLFSPTPSTVPCKNLTISVRKKEKLIAASFFDVLPNAISSIYAAYDLQESGRGLGLFTLLKEIEFAQLMNKHFVYHGYASLEPSFYDYKKRFTGLEYLDWKTLQWFAHPKTDQNLRL